MITRKYTILQKCFYECVDAYILVNGMEYGVGHTGNQLFIHRFSIYLSDQRYIRLYKRRTPKNSSESYIRACHLIFHLE